jgi:signal transduction histidine kinase
VLSRPRLAFARLRSWNADGVVGSFACRQPAFEKGEALDQHGGIATIIVEDDGPGIPVASLSSAAEAFVRIEPYRNRGTGSHGLGLAIVAAIARAHGGKLHLSNRFEGGLRAEINLQMT